MSGSTNSISTVLITCPHCNAEAKVDKSRLPDQQVSVMCHTCKNKFDFNPNIVISKLKQVSENSTSANVDFQWEKPLQISSQNITAKPKTVESSVKTEKPFFKTNFGIALAVAVALLSLFAMIVFVGAASIYKKEKELISQLNKNYTSLTVTKEERVAMRMLSILTDALENKDANQLKMISANHKNKPLREINKELDVMRKNDVNNFKLANVTVFQTTPTIIGEFTYSAQQKNPDPNAVVKVTNVSTLNYQVGQINGKPTLVVAPSGKNLSYSLEKVAYGQKRFGVDDIRKLN